MFRIVMALALVLCSFAPARAGGGVGAFLLGRALGGFGGFQQQPRVIVVNGQGGGNRQFRGGRDFDDELDAAFRAGQRAAQQGQRRGGQRGGCR